jgi:tRNA-Thr(GGU) m(6)t(6)A37 methyltransferase TsaA
LNLSCSGSARQGACRSERRFLRRKPEGSAYDFRMEIILTPIGVVHSSEASLREDDWGEVVSEIHLDANAFSPDALVGLAEFSHVEVLFHFHNLKESSVVKGKRHPRGNAEWPLVGIFAQRGKNRPNRIGATICRLLSVEGLSLRVQGLDAFHGSPVLDIKPVMLEFIPDRAAIRQPKWSSELMAKYF